MPLLRAYSSRYPGRCASAAHGFTLVEIALVVVIASILLIAGMRLMIARAESAQIEVTKKNQDAIKTALISYLGQNNRLPCPDANVPPTGVEARNVGAAIPPCVAYVGTVPYVTLGLDRSAVLDGWDNYIAYVVSPNLSTPFIGVPWTTSWVYTYAQPAQVALDPTHLSNAGPPAQAFWPTVSTGAITVNDVNGIAISNPNPAVGPPTGAVVVLISYGRDGYGAMNVSGTPNNPAGAGPDELQNINPVVAAGPPMQLTVVNRDITDQNIALHGPFDDIVLPLRQNDLVAPLVTSGTFPSSPMQTLNQANDYVIGQIVATHAVCPVGPATPCAGTPVCNPGSYYALPLAIVLPATSVVTYTQGPITTCIASNTPPGAAPNNVAYTLATPDGNLRVVTISEIIGTLGRVAGFN